jgi:hypothetical protein
MFQNPSILVQQGGCEGLSDALSAAERRGRKAGRRKGMSAEGKRRK